MTENPACEGVVIKVLALVLMLIPVTASAQRQTTPAQELTAQSLLAVGKGTGACGILNMQLIFQDTTGMDGGNEFIVRFWTTEAARLGMTLERYAEHCKTTIASYDRLWEIAGNLK